MIKERTDNQVVIRVPHYGHSFKVIAELARELKKDFPELKDEDIRVVKYGGKRYANTFGVECELPFASDRDVLSGYEKIEHLEYVASSNSIGLM